MLKIVSTVSPSTSKVVGTYTVIVSFDPILTLTDGVRDVLSLLSKMGAVFVGKIFSITQKWINSLTKYEVLSEVTLFEAFKNILY